MYLGDDLALFRIKEPPQYIACGATRLQVVTRFYGRSFSVSRLQERCHTGHLGVSMLESIEFRTLGVKLRTTLRGGSSALHIGLEPEPFRGAVRHPKEKGRLYTLWVGDP